MKSVLEEDLRYGFDNVSGNVFLFLPHAVIGSINDTASREAAALHNTCFMSYSLFLKWFSGHAVTAKQIPPICKSYSITI